MRIICLTLFGTAAFAMTIASPAPAQMMVDIPTWSNGILGQQAMRSTFDNYDEIHGTDDADESPGATSETCSADALPVKERRRMEAEYVRRVGADGTASADAWVREQGRQFRLRLVAAGTCPDPKVGDKGQGEIDEEGCRMVMRPVAGLGGAHMTMAMVPDCD